jgi:hypothetical protein
MAVTYESAGRVRQRAREYTKSPAIFFALKALFLYLATTKKNPDLAFLSFDSASIDDAGGQVLADAATTVYAVYGKKRAAADTDSYLVLLDDATDDAGGATDARVSIDFQSGEDEAFLLFPNGIDMATGVVAKAYTDYDGTTDSSAGDAPDGFVIVAAA